MSLLVRLGLRFPDAQDEHAFVVAYGLRLRFLSQVALFLGGILILLFSLVDRYVDLATWETGLAIRAFVMAPAAWLAMVLISIRSLDRYYELTLFAAMTVTLFGLIAICILVPASFAIYALPISLASMFGFTILPIRVVYMLVIAGILMVAYPLAQLLVTGTDDPRLLFLNIFSMATLSGIGLLAGYIREVAARGQFTLAEESRKAREATEHLLHSLMPSDIVKRMQNGENPIVDAHADATIVFADLVGFTALTRRLSPKHMVDLVARIFQRFDELADEYGLQRIKTLGDGYLAVGGIRSDVGARGDPKDSAAFALELSKVVSEFSAELAEPLQIRIGIHVGYLIVGVVGGRNLIFDCWGDSVNYAARLQSHASIGTILMSEPAYLRLHKYFNATRLDDVDLKGIGPVKVFQLCSALNSPAGF